MTERSRWRLDRATGRMVSKTQHLDEVREWLAEHQHPPGYAKLRDLQIREYLRRKGYYR